LSTQGGTEGPWLVHRLKTCATNIFQALQVGQRPKRNCFPLKSATVYLFLDNLKVNIIRLRLPSQKMVEGEIPWQ
jgi:hypothetical protein